MNNDDTLALRERWERVRARLAESIRLAGRSSEEVTLIAVSKLHSADAMAYVAGLGQVDFGENYVQEACAKQEALALSPVYAHMHWHFIGHLQSRKAAHIVGRFALIHTVDSLNLAEKLNKHAVAMNVRQDVLIQVNIGAEAQKSGVNAADLPALAEAICALPYVRLQGLMCLPPVFDNGPLARPHFAHLRELRDSLRSVTGLPLPHLSMGMSGDFEEAVLEGSTLVRVGTDIFGPRLQKMSS